MQLAQRSAMMGLPLQRNSLGRGDCGAGHVIEAPIVNPTLFTYIYIYIYIRYIYI